MRITHYPGKAVINDPAWLEMDIPNSTRGLLYEANWLDAQKNLSSSNSSSNSEETSLYAVPNKARKKYHSEKCLSRINSRNQSDFSLESNNQVVSDYYLPSQNKIKRAQSFKSDDDEDEDEERIYDEPEYEVDLTTLRKDEENGELYVESVPKPKPRTKIPMDKYKNVITDLEQQIKKSVRFNEGEEEEGEEEATQERVSEWIDDQNRYIQTDDDNKEQSLPDFNYSSIEDKLSTLNRNDSGYYEAPRKIRQRIPPKNIYPSSASDTESCDSYQEQVYDLYKSEHKPKKTVTRSSDSNSDFSIPRPKLIVPVHSYGVRKRRTGNLFHQQQPAGSECSYSHQVDGGGEGEACCFFFLARLTVGGVRGMIEVGVYVCWLCNDELCICCCDLTKCSSGFFLKKKNLK